MPKHTAATANPRPYDQMHMAIMRGYKLRWWWIPAIIVGVITAGIAGLMLAEIKSWIDIVSYAVLYGLLGSYVVFLYALGAQSLKYSDNERTLVDIGLAFLSHSADVDERVIEAIDTRAEVGSAAGQIRTLFPIFVLPIAFSFSGTVLAMPPSVVGCALMILVAIGFTFFRELIRANTDTIIRHAIAEYRCGQSPRKVIQNDIGIQDGQERGNAIPREAVIMTGLSTAGHPHNGKRSLLREPSTGRRQKRSR